MAEYQGPDRRKSDRSEYESKLTIRSRSTDRAHMTDQVSEQEAITEINVTPLVDVSLVLVIIFMAVSPFMLQAGLMVSESKAGASKGKAALDENVQISLSEDNSIHVNGDPVLLEGLPSLLRHLIPKSKDGLVTLLAEKNNLVGQVVEILDIAKQSGARKVAILNKFGKEEEKESQLEQ